MQAERAYNTATSRNLTASLDTILKAGGNPNSIGDIYDRSQDGARELLLIDEQIRANKTKQLFDANTAYAGEQDKTFQINEYAPYADRAAAAATLKQQGTDNLWKGVNTAVGGFVNQQQADLYKDAMKNLYPQTQAQPSDRNIFTTEGPNNGGRMSPPFVQGNVFVQANQTKK